MLGQSSRWLCLEFPRFGFQLLGFQRLGFQLLELQRLGFGDCHQLRIARIKAEILMVAKFENVSDTAYGKMISSLCRIAPQV